MKRLLLPTLLLASLFSAQAAMANSDMANETGQNIQQPAANSQPQPIIIAWDRVGDKFKGWV